MIPIQRAAKIVCKFLFMKDQGTKSFCYTSSRINGQKRFTEQSSFLRTIHFTETIFSGDGASSSVEETLPHRLHDLFNLSAHRENASIMMRKVS